MNEQNAESLAAITGGNVWNSGGNVFLVVKKRSDEKIVIYSDDCICLYVNELAYYEGEAIKTYYHETT